MLKLINNVLIMFFYHKFIHKISNGCRMNLGQPCTLLQMMPSDYRNPAYILPCFIKICKLCQDVALDVASSFSIFFLLILRSLPLILTSPSCPLRHSLANLQFLLQKRPHETLIGQVLQLIIDFLSTRSEEHQAWSDLFCLNMLWEGSRTLKTPVSPKR